MQTAGDDDDIELWLQAALEDLFGPNVVLSSYTMGSFIIDGIIYDELGAEAPTGTEMQNSLFTQFNVLHQAGSFTGTTADTL